MTPGPVPCSRLAVGLVRGAGTSEARKGRTSERSRIFLLGVRRPVCAALLLRDGNLCDLTPDHAHARAVKPKEVHVAAGAKSDVVVSLW